MYENGQWIVTVAGLRGRIPGGSHYHIETERLLQRREGGLYLWPQQVADKAWVDFDAFEAAYRKALEILTLDKAVDLELLERSMLAARDRAVKRR